MTIEGHWQMTEARTEAGALPDDVIRTFRLEISGTTYTVRTLVNVDIGRLLFFPGTSPSRMEIHGEMGPNMGRKFNCIYRLDGDELKILYDLSGTLFPPNFDVPLTGPLFLAKFSRA